MPKDSTPAFHIADAIEHLWKNGRPDPTVREITKEAFKDAPVSAPLMQVVRNQLPGALRILSGMGSLAHPVTPFYYRLPVRSGVRRIPLDTVNRKKCVPLAAGPRGTVGVRKVESKDDPLLLEALSQSKVMMAGSLQEFEKKQQQAQQIGLLTKPVADVRDPAWFDQALLGANPQLTLPLGVEGEQGE